MKNPSEETLTQIAQALAAKEVTSEALVSSALSQIEADQSLNIWLEIGSKETLLAEPPGGIGADATRTLRARAINFNVLFDGAEDDYFVIDNDFRQIGLVKNPLQYDSTGTFTATAGRALKKMFVDDSTADFQTDQTLTGTTSTAQALIDIFDNTAGHAPFIYYHQTETTGFTPFQDAEEVSTSSGTANISGSAAIAPDVDPFSGDILYLDNRNTAVFRSTDQTEDVKIIIQL